MICDFTSNQIDELFKKYNKKSIYKSMILIIYNNKIIEY